MCRGYQAHKWILFLRSSRNHLCNISHNIQFRNSSISKWWLFPNNLSSRLSQRLFNRLLRSLFHRLFNNRCHNRYRKAQILQRETLLCSSRARSQLLDPRGACRPLIQAWWVWYHNMPNRSVRERKRRWYRFHNCKHLQCNNR